MIISVIQLVVALLLIGAVLLQVQGTGISNTFGGSGEFYRSRRSLEKILVWGTCILATFFGILSIILLFPHK